MGRIYMDNAATTRVSPEVLEVMLPFLSEYYGNPSSIYAEGAFAAKAIDKARGQVARALGARKEEIYFTSGGSESDNWAIKGVAEKLAPRGKHIITTAVEHHAVLHAVDHLEKQGFEITRLPVDEYGLITPGQLKSAIRPDTILVSIMYANNEIGTVMPIEELSKTAKKAGVLFHTDAVQAVSQIPIDLSKLPVDMLSLSGHKLHGPKGVGALFIRKGLVLPNLIDGGAQEGRRRAGTENTASIAGLGRAMELACENIDKKAAALAAMRDRLIRGISKIPETRLNGHPTKRLPGNVNFSIKYIEGESVLLRLDLEGIAASSGSACTSGSLDPSHVLLAIGLPHEIAHGSLRLSLSKYNTMEEVEEVIAKLPGVVSYLRSISPLYVK